MLGRSRRHRIDKWKAAALTMTLLLFLTGGVAGLMIGTRLGGYALIVLAAIRLAAAVASVLHSRGRRASPGLTPPNPCGHFQLTVAGLDSILKCR